MAITPGKSYYEKVAAFLEDESYKEIEGAPSAPVEVITTPGSVTASITPIKCTETGITVKWAAVSGANTYTVEYQKYGTNKIYKKETTSTSIALSGLSKNSEYYITILSGRKNAAGTFKKYGSGKYILSSVKPTKVTKERVFVFAWYSGTVGVTCSQKKYVDGYEWAVYTADSSKSKKIKTFTIKGTYPTDFFKNKNFKKLSFIKLRCRAYVNEGGKKYVGEWSDWTYSSPQPVIPKRENTSKGINITRTRIKGADRYVVYVSTKKNSGFKKFITTSKNSTTITKYGNTKLKSGKKYYYYVVAQNKVGKSYKNGNK